MTINLNATPPAKSLKSNTGGGSFCWIGIENAMLYTHKYTPPHCFFCNFAGWESLMYHFIEKFALFLKQTDQFSYVKGACKQDYQWMDIIVIKCKWRVKYRLKLTYSKETLRSQMQILTDITISLKLKDWWTSSYHGEFGFHWVV